jgi:DNA-binding beta-propeller fold protein YncE
LAIANVNKLLGFEVGDLKTGQRLYRIEVPGFPSNDTELIPSHGVALTPNEKEIWVVDSNYKYLHIFDATRLPNSAPTKIAEIKLDRQPKWVSFDLDGRFAYVAKNDGTGSVINAATRQIIGEIASSRKFLEVDFENGKVVRTSSRHSLGSVPTPTPN